jgi:hypothetical protein
MAAAIIRRQPDTYGHARLPASAHDAAPKRVDKIPYGRFRNVYLYITEACQLRCKNCYMGERLERAFENAHWTYSSRILHVSFHYTLYSTEDQLCDSDDIDVAGLQSRMVRTESVGDFYTLHHTVIHSVTAEPTPPR